jgi:hypothetical protein
MVHGPAALFLSDRAVWQQERSTFETEATHPDWYAFKRSTQSSIEGENKWKLQQ